jgi:hypothetical protein
MDDQILDYFGEFDPETRVVTVKYFGLESEARLYAARLKEAGLPSFLSNANTMTALPIGNLGIGLHIREQDLPEATGLIARVDYQLHHAPADQSFHDADLDDILYQQALHQSRPETADRWTFFILLLILLLLLQVLLG